MVIRILAVILALGINGCVLHNEITPLGAVHLPSVEKESVVEEIADNYCFCSEEEHLISAPANADITINIDGIDIRRVAHASTITVQRPAWFSESNAISDKPNYSNDVSANLVSSPGDCYVMGRKIICHRYWDQGVVFGFGSFTSTTEFHVDQSGCLTISNVSSGLGMSIFFLFPMFLHEKRTVKMQPISPGTPCSCAQ